MKIEKEFGIHIKQQVELNLLMDDIYNTTGQKIGFNTLRRYIVFLNYALFIVPFSLKNPWWVCLVTDFAFTSII